MNDKERQEEEIKLEELTSILKNDPKRIVLVVGSGVTRGAVDGQADTEGASWSGLIAHGLRRASGLRLLDSAEHHALSIEAGSGDPDRMIGVADRIVHALGGRKHGTYAKWLENAFRAVDKNARRTEVLDEIHALSQLGVRIATTNYDGVLERFLGLDAVVWQDQAAVENLLSGSGGGVLHLHGHWEKPESVVFGKTDYEELLKNPGLQAVLNSVRTLRTMVFVGTGAGLLDPNFGRLRAWAAAALRESRNTHFWMVREGEEHAIAPETLRDEHTTPILYAEHDELSGMLRRVRPSGPASPVLPGAPARTILLLLNVRAREDRAHLDVRDVRLRAHLEIADDDVVEVRMDGEAYDFEDPRWWDRVAADVRRAVAEVEARVRGIAGEVEFIVAGHAPLSVFAYAGQDSDRLLDGRVRFVNKSFDGRGWDVIESGAKDGAHVEYLRTPAQSEFLHRTVARHAVYANAIRGKASAVGQFVALKGALEPSDANAIAGLSNIVARHLPDADLHRGAACVGAEDIEVLSVEVGDELQRLKQELGKSRGVLGYWGPSWGAFEIGRALKPEVHGLVEVPHFQGDEQGYVPAMTLSGRREPIWFRRPRFLFMTAEPFADSRVRGVATFSAAEKALRKAGFSAADVCLEGATKLATMHEVIGKLKPHVVQLHMHGAEDGSVGLVGPTDKTRVATYEEILDAFRRSEVKPALVILTVCNSMVLGDRLLDVADHVIASGGDLDTRNAEALSRRMFELLAGGNSIWDAFETAKREELPNCPPADLRLLSNPTAASPRRVFFHRP